MNLEIRKLSFIQEIHRIQGEKPISQLETILRKKTVTLTHLKKVVSAFWQYQLPKLSQLHVVVK